MSSLDKMLGWFPHSSTEWLELIIVALLLWLVMVVVADQRAALRSSTSS
jgi:hypothetical protein